MSERGKILDVVTRQRAASRAVFNESHVLPLM